MNVDPSRDLLRWVLRSLEDGLDVDDSGLLAVATHVGHDLRQGIAHAELEDVYGVERAAMLRGMLADVAALNPTQAEQAP